MNSAKNIPMSIFRQIFADITSGDDVFINAMARCALENSSAFVADRADGMSPEDLVEEGLPTIDQVRMFAENFVEDDFRGLLEEVTKAINTMPVKFTVTTKVETLVTFE